MLLRHADVRQTQLYRGKMLWYFTSHCHQCIMCDVWHQMNGIWVFGTVWPSRLSLSSQTVQPGIHPGMPQQDIRATVASCVINRCFMEVRVSPFVHTATHTTPDVTCCLSQQQVDLSTGCGQSHAGRPVAVTTVTSLSLTIIHSRLSELFG